MNVPRGFRFYIKNHVTLEVFQKEKSGLCGLERGPQSYQFLERWKSKPRFHRGREPMYILLPPSTNLSLFSILSRDSGSKETGVRVHQRRSNTENRLDVSPATRRNSRRAAEKRNSLRNPPCVYVFTEAAEILRGNK